MEFHNSKRDLVAFYSKIKLYIICVYVVTTEYRLRPLGLFKIIKHREKFLDGISPAPKNGYEK